MVCQSGISVCGWLIFWCTYYMVSKRSLDSPLATSYSQEGRCQTTREYGTFKHSIGELQEKRVPQSKDVARREMKLYHYTPANRIKYSYLQLNNKRMQAVSLRSESHHGVIQLACSVIWYR